MSARRGLLLAGGAYLAWGLLSPGNEILLRQYTPMWMQVGRSLVAVLAVTAWLGPASLGRAVRLLREPVLFRALFFGTFLSFALFAWAQGRGLAAAYTTLGFYTSPLWTAALARPMLGERVGPWFLPTVVALLVGGWLAMTGGSALPTPEPLALALAVGAGLAWAVYAVLVRRHGEGVAWRDLLLASLLLGLPLFLFLAVAFEPWPDVAHFTTATWGWTVLQALVPTVLALGMFQASLRLVPAVWVNVLVGLELAGTVFWSWVLLGDTYTALQLVGLAVVLVAVSGYLWQHTRATS